MRIFDVNGKYEEAFFSAWFYFIFVFLFVYFVESNQEFGNLARSFVRWLRSHSFLGEGFETHIEHQKCKILCKNCATKVLNSFLWFISCIKLVHKTLINQMKNIIYKSLLKRVKIARAINEDRLVFVSPLVVDFRIHNHTQKANSNPKKNKNQQKTFSISSNKSHQSANCNSTQLVAYTY